MNDERKAHIIEIVDQFTDKYGVMGMNFMKLTSDLYKLSDEQLRVLAETEAPVHVMAHDIRGIAERDVCFVPKIRELVDITEFIKSSKEKEDVRL